MSINQSYELCQANDGSTYFGSYTTCGLDIDNGVGEETPGNEKLCYHGPLNEYGYLES